MHFIIRGLFFLALLDLLAVSSFAQSNPPLASQQAATNYDELIEQARALLKNGNFLEANSTAIQAIQQNPNRFEAYLVAATAQSNAGRNDEAKNYMDMALTRAPVDDKSKIQAIADKMQSVNKAIKLISADNLSSDDRLQYDALLLIVQDADKAQNTDQRYKFLQEFLVKSAVFLQQNDVIELWVIRAGIAIEMDDTTVNCFWQMKKTSVADCLGVNVASIAWNAGQKLRSLNLPDAKIKDMLIHLQRKGWLDGRDPMVVAKEEVDRKQQTEINLENEKEQKVRGIVDSIVQNSINTSLGDWAIHTYKSGDTADSADGVLTIRKISTGSIECKANLKSKGSIIKQTAAITSTEEVQTFPTITDLLQITNIYSALDAAKQITVFICVNGEFHLAYRLNSDKETHYKALIFLPCQNSNYGSDAPRLLIPAGDDDFEPAQKIGIGYAIDSCFNFVRLK